MNGVTECARYAPKSAAQSRDGAVIGQRIICADSYRRRREQGGEGRSLPNLLARADAAGDAGTGESAIAAARTLQSTGRSRSDRPAARPRAQGGQLACPLLPERHRETANNLPVRNHSPPTIALSVLDPSLRSANSSDRAG